MTDHAQALLNARLQVILHRALVEIRNLARTGADSQTHDLADAVEFLPGLVLRWDEEAAKLVRPALAQYESKYPGSSGRYTSILEMEEEQFNQLYRPVEFCWSVETESD